MSVLLFTLNASYVHTSLALRILCQKLREAGLEASMLERTLKDKRLPTLGLLYEANADIYAFSAYLWNVEELTAAARKLKALLPQATLIFGGPEVSYHADAFLCEHPYVDFVVTGEGEEALPALCNAIEREGKETVTARGRVIEGGRYASFAEDAVPYENDPAKPIVYYESSRGCPYTCAYCLSACETGVRAKSAEQTLRELTAFEAMPSVKVVKFVDRTFNYDRTRALAIWRGLLADCYTKTYHFEINAELIDDETLALLGRFPAGKLQLEAGVQSTNPETLAAVERRSDVSLCLRRLRQLCELGNIHVHADLIAGLPYEDLTSFGRSFDALYGCCHNLQLGFLKLLKGSPLEKRAEKYGIVCAEMPPYEVLKTAVLSFDDLLLLHRFERVLERYGNSGHFAYTLMGVTAKVSSPFAFFRSLAETVGEPEGISQLRAFAILKEVCLPLFAGNEEELIGRLRLDYYIHEAGSCPAFLNGGGELPILPIRRSEALLTAQKNAATVKTAAATEVHRFAFDPAGYYVIDRKGHRCQRVTVSM